MMIYYFRFKKKKEKETTPKHEDLMRNGIYTWKWSRTVQKYENVSLVG